MVNNAFSKTPAPLFRALRPGRRELITLKKGNLPLVLAISIGHKDVVLAICPG
jgi:hypothetical protein